MIKLQIIGHIGNDCTINEVNGKNVINFNVAHSEKYKDQQGNQVEKTIWVKCAYWTDRTAIGQYLKKGQLVYAEGTPEAEAYMNKDNQNVASLKMRVFQVQLLGSRTDNQSGNTSQGASYQSTASTAGVNQPSAGQIEEAADDLPF